MLLALSASATLTASAPQQADEAALLQLAGEGRVDSVELLLAKGIDPNARGLMGETALMVAAEGGHTEVVRPDSCRRATTVTLILPLAAPGRGST